MKNAKKLKNLILNSNIILQLKKIKLHVYNPVLILFFGAIYAIVIPPLWGLDEVAHTNRALEISQGQITPAANSKGELGNDIPSALAELEYYVYADLLDDSDEGVPLTQRKDVTDSRVYDTLSDRKLGNQYEPTMITAGYSPVAYPGPITGFMIARAFDLTVGQTLLLARLVGLLTFAITVLAALYILRDFKMKWIVVLVSLLPTTLSQASVISADTLTNGLGILLFSVVYASMLTTASSGKSTHKWLYVTAFMIALLLPAIKPNNIFLSGLVLLLPLSVYMRKSYAKLLKVFVVAAAAAVGVFWTKISAVAVAQTTTSMRPDQHPVDQAGQIGFLFDHPSSLIGIAGRTLLNHSDNYIQTLFGTIGWNLSPLPLFFILLIIAVMIMTVFYIRDEARKVHHRGRLIMATLALCGIASYFFIMYLVFSPVGWSHVDGVNGRYFIAFVPLVAALLAPYFTAIKVSSEKIKIVVPIVSIVTLTVSICVYHLVTYG